MTPRRDFGSFLEAHPRVADLLGCAVFVACVLVTALDGGGS